MKKFLIESQTGYLRTVKAENIREAIDRNSKEEVFKEYEDYINKYGEYQELT